MMSLFREDLLLTDKIFEFWTLKPQEGFMTYTDFWHKHFDGYKVDSLQRIRADTAKTINLNELITMMKSKDRAVYEENKWMFDGHARFLDGQKIENNKVGFLSYPRSGNSFLRKTLESTVGIPTGGCISLHTSTSLQIMGLKGEYITDDTTWIVKSHHPYKMPFSLDFNVNKVVIIVRNPLDVIISYACLANTMNHSTKPKFNFHEEYAEWWNDWVRLNAESMKRFFNMIFEEVRTKKYDVHFCRYEDLVNKKQEELEGIMKFLMEIEDIEGTNCQQRCKEVAEAGLAASQSYQLKKTTGKFNASEHMYTEEQKKYLHEQLAEFNHYFGYTQAPEGVESYSQFFTYPEDVKVESKYNEFRIANQKSQDHMFAEDRKVKNYVMNHDSNTFDMMDGFLERLTEPTLTHAEKELKIGNFKEE